MKSIILLGSILFSVLAAEQTENSVESRFIQIENNGSIEGTVQLASRSSGRRTGGGLYGRQARSSSNTTTTDSVLVILTSSLPAESNSQELVFLNQKDRKFQPGILPVQRGQTVRILNSDPVYHNVFSLTSPHKFDVGRRPKGEHYDVTFEKPGLVDVFCDIHSNMHAIIYVVPDNTISWTKIAGGESFSFDGLSEGSYALTFVAMGFSNSEQLVQLQQDETIQVGTITLNP